MTIQVIAGIAGGLVSAAGFVPYILSVVRGRTRPSAATWIIWTVIGTILGAGYWTAGARASIWVAAAYVAGPLATSLVALRYGDLGFSRFDKGCLAAAAASLVVWGLSGDPLLAMALNIFIDLLGALPTLRKAWSEPASEDALSWALFAVGNAVNLIAIESWTLAGALYPSYLFALTALISVLVVRRR